MASGKLEGKKPRTVFLTANKYQEKIVILAFFPSFLIFLAFILIVVIGNVAMSKAIFHHSFLDIEKLINLYSGSIAFFMCSFFLFSLMIVFVVSHNMIGGFDRIIRELDEIIAGHSSQKTIKSRPNDTLTKDLLKRINVLLESYVEQRNRKS